MTAENKLKKLIVYVLLRMCLTNVLGVSGVDKLKQILFEADFLGDIQLGTSLTGVTYIMNSGQPTPNNFDTIITDMKTAGDLADRAVRGETVLLAQVDFDKPFLFTLEQQNIICLVINNNTQNQTFALTGHEGVADGNTIPYGTISLV